MAAPLILLFLPFLDVALSIARRFLTGKPIFAADRGHIHHRLLALGFRPRHVALTAYAACGMAAAVSLIQSSAPPLYGAFLVAAFAGLVWLAVSRLGYREFRASYRAVWSGQVRRLFEQEILLDQLRGDLAAAQSVEECWDHLCEAGRTLGLSRVMLRMGEHDLRADLSEVDQEDVFHTRLPLPNGGSVEFTGRQGDASTARLLLPVAGAFRDALKRRPASPVSGPRSAPEPAVLPDRYAGTSPR
jgi:UDP-GlcNAc:undecaprenyl-phosphate GlcNAc-1-phosphate transferase